MSEIVGGYSVVKTLQQAGTTHIYLARPDDGRGEPRHVIRHLVRPEAWDSEQYRRACDDFLLSASTQQQAARYSRWWAPIHKVNEAAPAAVTDYYEKSADWLISRRVGLGHRDLFRIISGVLTGLKAIENACSRPHGNLKPSNVLIGGKGRIAKSKVALCDPAPSRALLPDPSNPHASRASDLRLLGQMLYELVTHDPFNEIDDYPVQPGRFDSELGRVGKRWVVVCNELLRPDADATPQRVKQVHAMVRRLKPLRSKLAVPALILLLAGAGAGGVLATNWREWFDNRVQANVRGSDARQPQPDVTRRPATGPANGADAVTSKVVDPLVPQTQPTHNAQTHTTQTHGTQTNNAHNTNTRQFPDHQKFTEPDPRERWPGRQGLVGTQEAVASLEKEFGADAAGEFKAALARVQERWVRAQSHKWTAASRATVERELAEMTDVLRVLQHSSQSALTQRRELAAWQASMRKRDSISRTKLIDDEWSRRRDELLKSTADPAAQRKAVESLEAVLSKLDTDLPAGDPPAAPDRSWSDTLGATLSKRREQSLRDVLGAVEIRDGVAQLPSQRVAAAKEALEQWKRTAASVMADHAQIESSLSSFQPLDAPLRQGGSTARQLYAAWDNKLTGLSPEPLARRVQSIRSRVEALIAVEKVQDPAALLSMASGANRETPEVMLAAWRRLAAQPGAALDLVKVKDTQAKLLRAFQGSPAMAAEVNQNARAFWQSAYTRASTAQAVEQALASMSEFGVTADAITDPRQRHNLLLYSLKQRMKGVSDDASAAKLAQDLVPQLASLKSAQAAALAEALRNASVSDAGPAAAGITPGPDSDPVWKREPAENGGVRFLRDDGAGGWITIQFVRVNPPAASGVAPFYLSANEVSLELFAHAVKTKGNWPTLAGLIAAKVEREARGPRVWRWQDADTFVGLLHAAHWVPQVRVSHLDARRRSIEGWEPAEARDLRPPDAKPGVGMPMQQVTAPAAAYVASLLGCRLPTSAEWKAAYAAQGESADEAAAARSWNLRDAAWAAQHRYATQRIAEKVRIDLPDEGVFGPPDRVKSGAYAQVWNKGLRNGRPVSAPDAELYSDGVLWFRPVAEPAQASCRNLVGNVAEFVVDDPAVWKELAAPGGWKSGGKLLAGAKVSVIGGSALSPPELPLNEPVAQKPDEVLRKYPDVGFRLAFPAPASGEPVLAKLRKVVDAQSYLTR